MNSEKKSLSEVQDIFWKLVDKSEVEAKKAEANYSAEQHKVWDLVVKNLSPLWVLYTHPVLIKAAEKMGIFSGKIPTFASIDQMLKAASGFRVYVCDGVLDFTVLSYGYSMGYFPTTLFIRTMEHLKYIETPDMIHERVGHLVALSLRGYANAVKQFGKIALDYLGHGECIKALDKIHWWGVEFPLVWYEGKIKVVGPGILSSPGEMVHSITAKVHPDTGEKIQRITITNKNAFTVLMDIVRGPKHNIHVFQTKYLVFESFEVFEHTLTKTVVLVMQEIKQEGIVIPYEDPL